MFVSFDSIPGTARIWVYQSNRKFSCEEVDFIQKNLEAFCGQWTTHGAPIKSSVSILYNQFIVLAADDSFNAASGCSIDTTLRLFQQLETELGCSLLDRATVAFLENEEVKLYPQKKLKELFVTGILNKSSLAFNNVVSVKSDLHDKWLVPVENCWISRFLPKDTVAS